MKRRGSGFTLIEAVVVIAVVAILSAIIVPLVAKQIEESKIGRAKNEVAVIGHAILNFYKDVGIWPAAASVGGSGVSNTLQRLVSGTAVADLTTGNGVDYGYTTNANDAWYDATETDADDKVDVFDNHLNANQPEGDSGARYPTTGESCWKGPYLPPIGKDPWGHAYCCNIGIAYGDTRMCVVISAGPNGLFDSANSPPSTTAAPSGDDIWFIVKAF